MDTWEGFKGIDNTLDDRFFPPHPELDGLAVYVRDEMELDFLTWRDMSKRDLFLMKGQAAIGIDHEGIFQAEHLF